MTLHVALNHQSRYEYDRPVQMGPQVIRLRPAPHSRTPILSYALKIEPEGYLLNWQQDPHGNFIARVVYPDKVKRFHVEVDLVADMIARDPLDFVLEREAESYPFEYEPLLKKDLEPYLATPAAGQLLAKWLRSLRALPPQPTVPFLLEVNRRLHGEIRYETRDDPGVQSPEETLALKSGSARDSGWLLVQVLRHLGIASRFVSGYLIQLVPDVKPPDDSHAVPADFTDLHAWAEAYLPGAGWIGLDPSSGTLAGEGHIPLACTVHPLGAAPIAGLVEECETRFEHAMTVRRAVESPRVTKPYSEEQWRAIDELGRQISAQLEQDDARLAIGAQPTFVAAGEPDALAGSAAGDDAALRDRALELAERLRGRLARLEGAPADLDALQVTARADMLEVAMPLCRDWSELRRITEAVHEDAHASGLVAERFLIDGRPVGTGGGNHIVLGAAAADDSPFLRRPDLLASLVTYWQHHPALSYLFAGRAVGPAGAAPRADEARRDALCELGLALRRVARAAEPSAAVLAAFRALLVDAAGRAERAEIRIDELCAPDGTFGDGIVELRAFETTPHPRMSLAYQLLVLAIVARFWRTPYRHELVRWGTQLHDRFMLPHFVWADLCDVVADMRAAGYMLDAQWFAPHFEFRFPLCGTVSFGGIELELREALEPTYTPGSADRGAARGDDAELARLQVKVRGITEGRYLVACNGARVPLVPTGDPDELVGGVRFRAVCEPRAKAAAADAPLVFDLYDRWSQRAVAGCTYHVGHPAGRPFTGMPASAHDAESRRLARFVPFGHTPGGDRPEPRAVPCAELPYTLDLRWADDS